MSENKGIPQMVVPCRVLSEQRQKGCPQKKTNAYGCVFFESTLFGWFETDTKRKLNIQIYMTVLFDPFYLGSLWFSFKVPNRAPAHCMSAVRRVMPQRSGRARKTHRPGCRVWGGGGGGGGGDVHVSHDTALLQSIFGPLACLPACLRAGWIACLPAG